MSFNNFTTNILSITDENITFLDETYKTTVNKLNTIVFVAKLTYKAKSCPKCGNCDDKRIIKNGSKNVMIRISPINGQPAAIDIKKQRFLCKECKSTFIAETSLAPKFASISNRLKMNILRDLSRKVSEKDIASINNVSHATVSRYIDKDFKKYNPNKNYLPENLSFDEFKSTKDSKGSMSFIFSDLDKKKVIDIVENRQQYYLEKYFDKFTKKARDMVKTVCVDMYKPYINLINKKFPNAVIIFDKFHILNHLSRALNKTRINAMNKFSVYSMQYKRLKRYWRLILKNFNELDHLHYNKTTHFNTFKSQRDIVEDSVSCDELLQNTYDAYQIILNDFQNGNIDGLKTHLKILINQVSPQMKTAFKTLIENFKYVENTMKYNYTNGFTEGINNFIKVLKRIAFGYKSFFHFRNRILITLNLKQILQPIV